MTAMDNGEDADDREVFSKIHALLASWAEGRITGAEAAHLEDLLRASRRARGIYLDYVQDTVLLGTLASRPGESGRLAVSELFVCDLIEDLEAEQERLRAAEEAARQKLLREQESQDTPRKAPTRKSAPPYYAVSTWAAIAAGLMLVAWVNSGPTDGDNQPGPAPNAPSLPANVATISTYVGTEAISFQSADTDRVDVLPSVGTRLKVGKYSLRSGLVELRFDSGPLTVIQGPAEFELWAKNGMELKLGKAVAKVPPAAQGFAVSTSSASIIDLGTEFAVAADNDGGTEVLVLDGKVALKSRPIVSEDAQNADAGPSNAPQAPPYEMELTAGKARMVNADRTVSIIKNPNRSKFLRSLEGLVAVDDFETVEGKNPTSGGIGFLEEWVVNRQEIAFQDGGVRFVGREGAKVDTGMHRKLPAIDASSKPVYFSAEFRISGDDPLCSCWLVLSQGDPSDRGAVIGLTDGEYTVRSTVISRDEAKQNGSAGAFAPGSWHFLVGRYQADAAGNLDKISIWIDPAVDVPGDPQKEIVDDLGYTQIDTVSIMFWDFGKAENGRGDVDNVRVGTSWAAVQ